MARERERARGEQDDDVSGVGEGQERASFEESLRAPRVRFVCADRAEIKKKAMREKSVKSAGQKKKKGGEKRY